MKLPTKCANCGIKGEEAPNQVLWGDGNKMVCSNCFSMCYEKDKQYNQHDFEGK